MAKAAITPAERLGVASRVAAAVIGGYAFATVVGVFLSRALPMTRADAVLAATLASFSLYAVAAIWVLYRVIRGYLLFKDDKPVPGM